MSTQVINSDESLQRFFGVIRGEYLQHRFLRATWKTGKDRSLPQNSFTHAWYGQMARELPEDDALGWKCYCKLHHGVPILRAEDDEFREVYDAVIKPLSYERKLIAMREWPVTSRMTRKQLTQYAQLVQEDFAARGVILVVEGSK